MIKPKVGDYISLSGTDNDDATRTLCKITSVRRSGFNHRVGIQWAEGGVVDSSVVFIIERDRFATDAEVLAAKLRGEL